MRFSCVINRKIIRIGGHLCTLGHKRGAMGATPSPGKKWGEGWVVALYRTSPPLHFCESNPPQFRSVLHVENPHTFPWNKENSITLLKRYQPWIYQSLKHLKVKLACPLRPPDNFSPTLLVSDLYYWVFAFDNASLSFVKENPKVNVCVVYFNFFQIKKKKMQWGPSVANIRLSQRSKVTTGKNFHIWSLWYICPWILLRTKQ